MTTITTGRVTSQTSTFAFRAALEHAGLSQAQFARCAGLSPRNVNRIYKGELPVPRACMVILSMMYALSELVSKSEPLDKLDVTLDISELLMVIKREGQLGIFTIRRDHVFRSSETYKMLAMRFHPDRAGRDTTEEMQIINHYKNTGLRMEMREAA